MSLKSILAYPFAYIVKLRNDRWIKNPLKFQKKTFYKLIEKAKKTTFGIDHGLESIKTYNPSTQLSIKRLEKLHIQDFKKDKQVVDNISLIEQNSHLETLLGEVK